MQNVRAFLYEAKKLVSVGRKVFIKRKGYELPDGTQINYLQALLDLDIGNIDEAWGYVLSLSPNHYHAGPIPDRDRPDSNDMWVFKRKINDIDAYIKLKIDNRGCVCISFHEDWG
ncbi:hypothetical protein [Radiobacillus sp. PE A8.2]|uniref:hypothetical protein n=1 Tax=Radiobacillus sp. PE A8.2 TaxID=3380349 RepID=UPI00388E20DB